MINRCGCRNSPRGAELAFAGVVFVLPKNEAFMSAHLTYSFVYFALTAGGGEKNINSDPPRGRSPQRGAAPPPPGGGEVW
jgi:hypothetical protein